MQIPQFPFARSACSLIACIALSTLTVGCKESDKGYSRAAKITTLNQAIGGPTANARVGDFLLENDQIRAVIEQGGTSFHPTDVGGSLIDLDLQRPEGEFRGGRGLDALGQIAPIANLSRSTADAEPHVRITQSGLGAEVTVSTEAQPIFKILNALSVLIDQDFVDNVLKLNMYTEYEVRPGERLVRIVTSVGFNADFCRVTESDNCNPECEDALYDDDCTCEAPARCGNVQIINADALPDRETASILDVLLGDLPRPLGTGECDQANGNADCVEKGETCVRVTLETGGDLSVCRAPEDRGAGMFLGDLLVFGGNLTPFVPEIGYDTETDVRRLFDQNKDTLAEPLNVGAIYATGDRVSMGYYSPAGQILVPIFRGPFSLGATHAVSCPTSQPGCLQGTLDEGTPEERTIDGTVVRFERWVSVGEGDVASAQAPIMAAAGISTGTIQGTVTREPTGVAASGVSVYAVADPRSFVCDASCIEECGAIDDNTDNWTFEGLRQMNRCRTREKQYPAGTSAVETFALTDPGTDRILDGKFSMKVPAGKYVLVAFDHHKARSGLAPVAVTAGGSTNVFLGLPEPATLSYSIFDENGKRVPAKVTIGHLPTNACVTDAECTGEAECQAGTCSLPWQTLLPMEFGGHRPADGILYSEAAVTGDGSLELPEGEYEVLFSRGPHYSIEKHTVSLSPRVTTHIDGFVRRVVDKKNWISADFHVHATNSLDSGTAMDDRVASMVIEDMDFFTGSDHDWVTDYTPTVREMGLADQINTMVGLEITTQEYGHYLAFPLRYNQWKDGERLTSNDPVQWRNRPPQSIIDEARSRADGDKPVIIDIPHPYDYFDFYRLDAVTLEPTNSLLAFINPMLEPSLYSGDFDAMELVNTKTFSRIRRATVGEVKYYSERLDTLIAELDAGTIDLATYGRRWLDLSIEATRRRLHRTVAEQEAHLSGVGATEVDPNDDTDTKLKCLCGSDGLCAAGTICEPSTMTCVEAPGSSDPAPPDETLCKFSRGIVDDWFNMLNRGVFRTGLSGGDAHGLEGGFMRTFLHMDGVSTPYIDDDGVLEAVQKGRAVVSNGPMVHFTIDSANVGDTLTPAPGTAVTLHVRVEKASWYDVDRIEVYRNGHLIQWANGCGRARGNDDEDEDTLPCIKNEENTIVAWDQSFPDTPERDAWYVVLVYGLDGRTLAPVYTSEVLAELGISEITNRLFTIIPGLRDFRYPRLPTIYPVFPFAFTNPIWVDLSGDGWTPPQTPPSWCRPGDFGC